MMLMGIGPLTPMGGVGPWVEQLGLYVQRRMGADKGLLCIANNEHRNLLPWSVGRRLAGCLISDTFYQSVSQSTSLLYVAMALSLSPPLQQQIFQIQNADTHLYSFSQSSANHVLRSSASLISPFNFDIGSKCHTHTPSTEGTKLGYISVYIRYRFLLKKLCP